MDDLSLLFQNKWSVGILIVSGLLIALAIGSSTIRGISQRQEEERARTNPPQTKGASSKAQLISGIIGAFIGVFLAFAVSGFHGLAFLQERLLVLLLSKHHQAISPNSALQSTRYRAAPGVALRQRPPELSR